MRTVLYAAPSLAWTLGMGLMMWFMDRGTLGVRTRDDATSLDALRAQRARHGARLDEHGEGR